MYSTDEAKSKEQRAKSSPLVLTIQFSQIFLKYHFGFFHEPPETVLKYLENSISLYYETNDSLKVCEFVFSR